MYCLPNSKPTLFKLDSAAAFMTSLPTSVDPVNATLLISGWEAIAAPAVGP